MSDVKAAMETIQQCHKTMIDLGKELTRIVVNMTTIIEELGEIEQAVIQSLNVTSDAPAKTEADVDPAHGLPAISHGDLGSYLQSVVQKYGPIAQDVIKDIILARGGTQALSQVPDRALPVIKRDVDEWVGKQQ